MLAGRKPRRVWFLSLVFGVALPAVAAPANRIHQVRLSQESGLTVVEIEGERALNFTTFKQDAPRRVVIDMAECSFTGVPRTIVGDGHLVETIATSEIAGGPHNISRVVISLSREVEYRVTARGGSLFIYLTPGTGGLLVSAGIPMAPERAEPDDSSDSSNTLKNTNLSLPLEENIKPIQLAMATPKDTTDRIEISVEPAREGSSLPVMEPKPTPVPAPKQTPVVESRPVPLPAAKPIPVVDPKPAPEPELKPLPAVEPKPLPAPKPAPMREPKLASAPEPTPDALVESKPLPVPKLAPVIEQKVAPAPAPKPIVVAEVKPVPVPEPKPAPVVESKPVYAPETKPIPVLKQKSEVVAMIQPQPIMDRKLTPATTQERVTEKAPLESRAKSLKTERAVVSRSVDMVAEAPPPPSEIHEDKVEDISPPEPPKAATNEVHQPLKVKSDETPYRPRATEFVSRVGISRSTKNMTWVGFQQTQDSSQVFVKTNEPVRYRIIEETAQLVILELENTKIPKRNDRRFLDTHFFNTAVTMITPREVYGPGHNVRIEIQLKDRVPYTTGQESNVVFIRFQLPK
jgi:hypothetical protein